MRPIALLFFLTVGITCDTAAQQPPVTKKQSKIFQEHGRQRTDDYYWLSNPQDSAVINHLKAENAYVDAYLKSTAELQKTLFNELVDRIEQTYVSLPVKENGYWYYTRYAEGEQYPYHARKKGNTNAREEIILDVPKMAKGYQVYLVRGYKVSKNNRYLAYGIDTNGSRRSDLYFKDLQTGRMLKDQISNTSSNYEWSNDNRWLYYVLNDHTVRAYKVMRHELGTDVSLDKEVYHEKDSTFGVYLYKSRSQRYIFIARGNGSTSEVSFLDADNVNAAPVMIQPRQAGLLYTPNHYEGQVLHIRTNHNAVNFKAVTASIHNPSLHQWKELIPHNPNGLLERFDVVKNYYVGQWKEHGLTVISAYNRSKKIWKAVHFDQDAYVASYSFATDDYNTDSIRYYFTSLATPGTDYLYSLRSGEKKLLKQQKAGKDFTASLYETKRIWARATDGTEVPISIVYRKNLFRKDGTNPMYLYAYGSYGANSDPYFNSSMISLMDRGVVVAIAHIRGGQEMGRSWYENAKVLTKKNTFTDYIDAAQYLVSEKYTAPDRLFANGVSAGGMLMGAITNMRPDLFRGVIAEVPWMDVITDMLNPDLPLTTLEYTEWGDPNKKEEYEYMLSWSPMDNVPKASFPAIFATGGLHDTQVPYFSPAKWVAKIREHNLGRYPVLFRVNLGAGHGGESGRFERQKLTAEKFAFMLDQLGWDESTKTFRIKSF